MDARRAHAERVLRAACRGVDLRDRPADRVGMNQALPAMCPACKGHAGRTDCTACGGRGWTGRAEGQGPRAEAAEADADGDGWAGLDPDVKTLVWVWARVEALGSVAAFEAVHGDGRPMAERWSAMLAAMGGEVAELEFDRKVEHELEESGRRARRPA